MTAPPRRHPTLPSWPWGVPALVLLLPLLLWPLAATIGLAIAPERVALPIPGQEMLLARLLATVGQAALSTLLALAIGLPAAYVFAQIRFPGRGLVRFIATLPLVLPTIVIAIAFEEYIGPDCWLEALVAGAGLPPLNLPGTLWAVVLAHAFVGVAIVIQPVADAWAHLDREQEEAARLLGATRLEVFREITWPLLRRAVTSATVLSFMFAFTSFAIVLILGAVQYETLEVSIFRLALQPGPPTQAALLSLLQFGTAVIVLLPSAPPRADTAVRRREEAGRTLRRSSWSARFLTLVVIFCIAALIVAPLASLAYEALTKDGVLTLSNFRGLVEGDPPGTSRTLDAIASSISLAVGSAALALVLGVTTAMTVAPAFGRATRVLQVALLLPLAVPPNALALGYLLTFQSGGSIFGVPWLVLLAHAVIATPVALRAVLPAARALNQHRVEAAVLLGAPPPEAWWSVALPRMRREIAIGALLAACVSLGQLGATLLLRGGTFSTIPIEIYEAVTQSGPEENSRAVALAAILGAIAVVAFVGIEWLRPHDRGEL